MFIIVLANLSFFTTGARLSAIDTNPTPDVDWTQCWEEVTVDGRYFHDCY